MPRLWLAILTLASWTLGHASLAAADDRTGPGKDCPPAVLSGSGDVALEGRGAARAGDQAGCGAIVEGSPNVFINGRPAAVVGDKTGCGGAIVTGTTGVFINGKPVAGVGSMTTDCPPK